ncbi:MULTISPECIES: alpha-amylase family glycosyl hydrolase [Kitasatospora]|uniref:Putative glycogen debranching enzyme n=1 Tax=Kitasatospora setae (strain ATCC 33774 / DSM 43861 / JCM 3304 / KCC A-0304 / NBRC 14216 / KM-6054) TaxID=452652 RepID=E4N416_KITSK|nr:alpha-amylase family glycosyl hydrolase [Kitasatospora setae]BAJ25947.1 putative glycogen debranching enzyme [Kitasatospora setae KM-6054]BAJ33331.1 putative glycogen debranching enzyme [Kitasatospora setae KM-6054]
MNAPPTRTTPPPRPAPPAPPAPAVLPGDPLRPGASPTAAGVTFTVNSPTAHAMWLVLLDAAHGGILREIRFPEEYRTGDVFTMTVPGLDPRAVHYAFRAQHSPGTPPGPLLLDPYAKALAGGEHWGQRPAYRSKIVHDDFDWQDVPHPRIAPQDLVVYELHVRGFTRHPSAAVRHPGTFAGLREKIPYLRALGVNCVELMPVLEFDETDNPFTDPATGAPLPDYWGYNPVAFFAPKAAYAADPWGPGPVRELKELVRELHRAGIEVILDVVLNHTAEGDHRGPTLSLRALHDTAYYLHDHDGSYLNLTRTGNTVNANHPVTRALLLDCLRHWASEFRVDGFRFDMAPILTRGQDGRPLDNPPLLEAISHDPVLAHCKLIAEPFDASGLDLVGRFPSHGRWMEWNSRFQYAVRRFLTGTGDGGEELAHRMAGSPDLYGRRGHRASVNLLTSHDGFTLADWTSYDHPHNEANGERGEDGPRDNASWNAGCEGPSEDPAVLRLRSQQIRNALLLLLTAPGVPMLTAGDEFGRTQHGNNNAYSQDNATGWLDWTLADTNAHQLAFVRACLALRAAHPVLRRPARAPGDTPPGWPYPALSRHGELPWRGEDPAAEGLLALLAHHQDDDATTTADTVFLAANTRGHTRAVHPPPPPAGTRWHLFADTSAPPGQDINPPGAPPGPALAGPLTLAGHSVTVLVAHPAETGDERDL